MSKYPTMQIGFSKFCSLCPKWCVLPDSSGIHFVSVCIHHQNMKLIPAPLGVSHTDQYEFLICNINSEECMIHKYVQIALTAHKCYNQNFMS